MEGSTHFVIYSHIYVSLGGLVYFNKRAIRIYQGVWLCTKVRVCVRVARGDFLRTTSIASMQTVRCPKLGSVRSWEVT